jgi:hypothetical protein
MGKKRKKITSKKKKKEEEKIRRICSESLNAGPQVHGTLPCHKKCLSHSEQVMIDRTVENRTECKVRKH